ncbi:GGDEF domain-containing protein, partial [Beijerinckia sp. L45]|uniref:GGDEF domain-containing protein n=1 Tax=Beijerinckia sp. L45 TaxID=1641855 RepID=UPI00131B8071
MSRAENDPLTSVRNRIGLRTWIERFAPARGGPQGKGIALLLIDIDHFKLLNDTDGHAAGDRVLVLLAGVATRQVRERDIVMRHGGDEFIVVLANTPNDEAVRIAERIRRAFADGLNRLDDIISRPTLSIGVAVGDLASEAFEPILRKADAALYRSKRLGRDRVGTLADETVLEIESGLGRVTTPELAAPELPAIAQVAADDNSIAFDIR